MIQVENITIGERAFKRTYSDEGHYIKKVDTEEIYVEAVDLPDKGYSYMETDEYIEVEEGGENEVY